MATITPSSISNAWLIPEAAFTVKKNDCSIKYSFSHKAGKQILSPTQRLVLPLSTSLRLFPTNGRQLVLLPHRSATGTDAVATVEEQDYTPVAADENLKGETDASEESDAPATTFQSRGTARLGRKSEMPAVKNEELVPGATFSGKVRAIQPFGAFVDFGAFTDGLVHVSQLSDNFVKDVSSVVTIGQEVKVRLVEADIESKRISLSMRQNDDSPKRQSGGSDSPRSGGRRDASKGGPRKGDGNNSKFVKGQMLDGTVKNLTRSGAFITIGEGEEGFLPTAEEEDDGIGSMMMGGSSLEAGQEVKVRVLRIARGRVTLTMKKEDDGKFEETLSQGVVHTATNPFVLAFSKNEEIAAFLDKREEETDKQPAKIPVELEAEASVTSDEEETAENFIPLILAIDEVSFSEAVASVEDEKEEVVVEAPAAEVETPASVVPEASSEKSGNAIKRRITMNS